MPTTRSPPPSPSGRSSTGRLDIEDRSWPHPAVACRRTRRRRSSRVRHRPLHRRGPVLDRHQPAERRGRRRVLRRSVRVGVRGHHAAGISRPVLRRPAPRRRRRGGRPRGRSRRCGLEHVRVGDRRRRDRGPGARRGRCGARGGARPRRRRADGRLRRPRRRGVPGLAARPASRRRDRQRARLAELQRPHHAGPRRRPVLLRLRVRLGDPRHRRGADVGARRLRGLPRAALARNA